MINCAMGQKIDMERLTKGEKIERCVAGTCCFYFADQSSFYISLMIARNAAPTGNCRDHGTYRFCVNYRISIQIAKEMYLDIDQSIWSRRLHTTMTSRKKTKETLKNRIEIEESAYLKEKA